MFSQNNSLSLNVNFLGTTNNYKEIGSAVLIYQYSFFDNILHIGPYFKYYHNIVKGSSLQLPDAYSGYNGRDNGIGYGINAKIYPLASNVPGTNIFSPYVIFNIGFNSGHLNAGSDLTGVHYRIIKQKIITGYGIGIMFLPHDFLSFFTDCIYEIRNPKTEYSIFVWPGAIQTEQKTITLSSLILNMGLRINF